MRKLLLLALLPLILYGDAHLFVYHRFGDDRHASTNTSLAALRAQFEYLKSNGYHVIPLATLSEALRNKKAIDDKWVVLTIDDSYKSFYENGLPLFREYGYPFTLFVYTKATDGGYGDYMTWAQIADTSQYGEIGLHSFGHEHMVSMDTGAIIEDTRKSYNAFKHRLGFAPRYYAYPYGEYNDAVRSAVASLGFELILNQNSGAVNSQSDPHDLDRIALTGETDLARNLRITSLPTQWLEPKSWPHKGKLKTIHAKIPEHISRLEYYVSGHGWQRATAKGGEVVIECDLNLTKTRTRIFLKSGPQQSSMILVKE